MSSTGEIRMPRLSDSMEEGTILAWLKQVGDEVAVGEELVEIESDKAGMTYESDLAGTLVAILADEGESLAVGAPLAMIGSGDVTAEDRGSPQAASSLPTTRIKASPLARRLAEDRGIDLASVTPSGPAGRIVRKDVEQGWAAGGPHSGGSVAVPGSPIETAKGAAEQVPLSRLEEVVARRMAEAKATIPHFYLEATVDMSAAVGARARLKASAPAAHITPSLNDLVVKACALALREFPRANGAYKDARLELYSRINVGFAVATRRALVVPTIFDADRKGLIEIAGEARALAAKVRDETITPPDLGGGTFTVSNLGMYGVRNFAAVVNPPQAAILAVGAIEERPVVRGGEIASAHLMEVTLSCDHRILYGAEAAEFLRRIRALLEEPLALAL